MFNFYTTIENQVRDNSSKGLLYNHFNNLNEALSKYYAMCAIMAQSNIFYRSAHILQNNGIVIERKVFNLCIGGD